MAYDNTIYGTLLDQWHRPGQTVVVNPTNRSSNYGIPSLPDSYDALLAVSSQCRGSVAVAVGSDVVILGGHMGCNLVGGGYYGYARKRLVGHNGGREWEAFDLDSPWTWPTFAGAWVVGSRIYVSTDNYNLWNKYTYDTDSELYSGTLGLISMYYSDDLGATWCSTDNPGVPVVGADNTNRQTNYDLLKDDEAAEVALMYSYGSCIHNGYFVVVQDRTIGVVINTMTYWTQAFFVYTMPTPELGVHGVEGRNFKCLGLFLPQGRSGAVLNQTNIGSYNYPSPLIDFDDYLVVGGGSFKEIRGGDDIYRLSPSRRWKMRFSPDMSTVESFEAETNEMLLRQTTHGVCSYRKQRWIYGGGLVTSDLTSLPLTENGSWGTVASMTNRMITSVNGGEWEVVSYGADPPAYPEMGFQNVPVRCRHPQMVFIPGTKEILIWYSWIGHEYYDDTLGYLVNGNVSPRQNQLFMAMMHSSEIDFPDLVPDETPWYNYPLGGSPGTTPLAPGETGDFTATGDIFRCLRIDLSQNKVAVGSGFPLVSTLQNSGPTSLPGQIPDKMLAGCNDGYLCKAMVPEAAGLGTPSQYVLWTLGAGSTTTVLALDADSLDSYLPTGYLTGLPVRILGSDGSYVERIIVSNGNDTITLTVALDAAPATGTRIQIAPMDCGVLLGESRYQYPARLAQVRINMANYQPVDQEIQIGVHTALERRRFCDFALPATFIQRIFQRQWEQGGGIVGIRGHASRSLAYDLRFTPNGGGRLEVGPIILHENVQPGEKGLS